MTDTVSRWEALGAQVSCAVERQGGRGEGSTGQRIVWRPHQAELGVGGSQSPERGAAGNQRAENGRSRSRGAGSLAGDQFHWQHGSISPGQNSKGDGATDPEAPQGWARLQAPGNEQLRRSEAEW